VAALAVVLAFVPLPGVTSIGEYAEDGPPLSVGGEAELVNLAELPQVDSALAERSLAATRSVSPDDVSPSAPSFSAGAEGVVSRYFETATTPAARAPTP
jgi:hypothetical protein